MEDFHTQMKIKLEVYYSLILLLSVGTSFDSNILILNDMNENH